MPLELVAAWVVVPVPAKTAGLGVVEAAALDPEAVDSIELPFVEEDTGQTYKAFLFLSFSYFTLSFTL
jgi:hypothetical protein